MSFDPFTVKMLENVLLDESNAMSECVLAYQLAGLYSHKFGSIILPVQSAAIEDTPQNYLQMVCQIKQQQDHPDTELFKYQYVTKKVQKFIKIMQQTPIDVQPKTPLELVFQKNLLPGCDNRLAITLALVCQEQLKNEKKIKYLVSLLQDESLMFLKDVYLCKTKLFDYVSKQYIDEQMICTQLYAAQKAFILKCEQNAVEYKYSLIYKCKKCKLKMCTFVPIQVNASDEETKARFTCHSPSCGYSWVS